MYVGGRAARPVLERAYNIYCDPGQAAALAAGGLSAVEQSHVRPGNPVRTMLAQRLSDATEIPGKLLQRNRLRTRGSPITAFSASAAARVVGRSGAQNRGSVALRWTRGRSPGDR